MLLNLPSSILLKNLRVTKDNFAYDSYDLLRKLIYPHASSAIVNTKEMRVVGLKRSGNHTIIHWIQQQQA